MLYPWLQSSFKEFSGAYLQGRLPSSVLIAGSRDLGVLELALECARFYLCSNKQGDAACGNCRSCLSFADGAHPDFVVVRSSLKEEADAGLDVVNDPKLVLQEEASSGNVRRSVRIDSIRKLIDWLNLSHVGGEGKVALVSDAHTMPEGAANSILKSFEEPPPHTLIILTAKSLESLLPTIRSRAYKIKLPAPSMEQALAFMQPYGYSLEQVKIALSLAQQAPLGALHMLQDGTVAAALQIAWQLEQTLASGHDIELIDALSELSPARQVTILGELIRELLKYKAGFALEQLPLLTAQRAVALSRLPAEHLFNALQELQHFALPSPFLAPRAPLALLRAWVQALAVLPQRAARPAR